MENVEIAAVLNEVADALEIQGANQFRVRAYRNAARTIETLTRPVSQMVANGEDLEELPGIGKDLSAYLTELCQTGHLKLLEEIEKSVPASLLQLMRLEGLGPKRAKLLNEKLGVCSIEDLEKAIDNGTLEEVRGFGEKSVEKLRRAIGELRRHTARFRLSEADQFVQPLLDYLRAAPEVKIIEAAGSYRRRRETVGDIDLLAICTRPRTVMQRFTQYPEAARVESAGGTRGTIVLKYGLKVDLRVLPERAYGAALHYFTGSKPHNIAVRKLGVERGLRISEYGVFRVGRGKKGKKGRARRIGGAREQEVFGAVGLPWIPPELREDRGEIEAAFEDELPRLIELGDIRGDLQMHSTWSDGRDSIEELARACLKRGYSYMALTDHSQAATIAGGIGPRELRRQWKEIERVRRKVKAIHLLRGMEVDILRDGSLDLRDEYIEQLDVLVVGVHSNMGMSKARMTDRVIKALAHPAVHILAHPTGRIINRRDAYEIDLEAVLEAAREYGVALELNAQPDRLDLSDVQVRRASELGVKVVIDTDAHSLDHLRFMSYGVDQARRGWLEPQHVLNTMTWVQLQGWLTKKKPAVAKRARPALRPRRKPGRRRRAATPR
ncbi:MAG: DNA polymerase/3'-5' exonuclease PolX [Gemmatimonadetes bacterium]|nr:DNA polymerase/3'-5' exonuclease PolX [Gemmatimonadota bacterium]